MSLPINVTFVKRRLNPGKAGKYISTSNTHRVRAETSYRINVFFLRGSMCLEIDKYKYFLYQVSINLFNYVNGRVKALPPLNC